MLHGELVGGVSLMQTATNQQRKIFREPTRAAQDTPASIVISSSTGSMASVRRGAAARTIDTSPFDGCPTSTPWESDDGHVERNEQHRASQRARERYQSHAGGHARGCRRP